MMSISLSKNYCIIENALNKLLKSTINSLKFLILIIFPLLLKNKKCVSHFRRETAKENKQFKETIKH